MMFSLETGDFSIQVTYKKIKHIYFRVQHQSKRILISAPADIQPEVLKNAVNAKKGWLKKQISNSPGQDRSYLEDFPVEETILYLGKAYPVDIHLSQGRAKVIVGSDGFIHIYVKPGHTAEDIRRAVLNWYRLQLKYHVSELISKWEPRMGVRVNEHRVRKMKTRWGSCNVTQKRIWINLALIRMDKKILEYVVVHEMVHLIEPSHNKRFKRLMSRFIPDWPTLKKQIDYTAVEPPSTLNV